MSKTNQQEITLRLRCRNLPGMSFEARTAVRLGIQQGREVVADVAADTPEVTFTVPLRVARNDKDGRPNFLGEFAQGTPDARFIYLCWGERLNGEWDGFRRAKVLLKRLEWEDVEKSLADNAPIEAVIDVTDKQGGPLCASVPNDKIEWKL